MPWCPCSTACCTACGAACACTADEAYPPAPESSQMRTVLSRETEATRDESGDQATSTISPSCPRSVCAHRHFSRFAGWFEPNGIAVPSRSPLSASCQSITSWSSEPEARNLPSGDHRAQLTAPRWPRSVASSRGTFSSCSDVSSRTGESDQSFTRWSCPAVAKRKPSGWTSTEKMGCPSCETHVGLPRLTIARDTRRE